MTHIKTGYLKDFKERWPEYEERGWRFEAECEKAVMLKDGTVIEFIPLTLDKEGLYAYVTVRYDEEGGEPIEMTHPYARPVAYRYFSQIKDRINNAAVIQKGRE